MQLDAYIRVSDLHGRGGESFISPAQQRERIEAWVSAHGHTIAQWHEEIDVPGGGTDRPMLNEMMRRVEARETGGVVVAKLNRFGRTLIGSLQLIERISEVPALFASVAENFDISTPTGRFVLNMFLSLAQMERETIGENWHDARVHATRAGRHVGPTPFGYVKDETTRLHPDPKWGYIITGVFERRAAGESWTAIRRWVEAEGAPCPEKSGWNSSRLSKVIGMEVYLGVVEYRPSKPGRKGERVEGAHEPLTDLATWHAAQLYRGARWRRAGEAQLMTGLVRCAGCRYTMTQRPATDRPEHPSYICKRASSAGDCKAPAQISSVYTRVDRVGLDEYVSKALLARWPGIVADAYGTGDDELNTLRTAAEAAEAEANEHATDPEIRRRMSRDRFLARGEVLDAEALRAKLAYQEALGERERPMSKPSRTLVEDWRSGELTLAEKRAVLASAVQAVFVRRGRSRKITGASASTVHIVWFDDAELVDVPRSGKRGFTVHPFVFPVRDNPMDSGVLAA